MEEFVAPIFHVWFHQNSLISTPDKGILYNSRYDVSYIPPYDSNCLPKTRMINVQGLVAALACSPDWSEQRLFATLDERNLLTVWDLDSQQAIKGHRAHFITAGQVQTSKKQHSNVFSALCFTKDGKLLSCVYSDLVVYCLITDRYKKMPDFFRNKTVVTLEPSPVDRDVFMAGLKDGLIQIFSIKKMAVLHSLRGHDKEIVSISCMSVPVLKQTVWRKESKAIGGKEEAATGSATKSVGKNRPKKQARKKAAVVAEESDCFDIYDFNESLEEFGTIVDRESLDDKRDEFREKAKTVEGFNFLEACENLKEDILKAASRREDEEEDDEALERSALAQGEFNTDDENELDDCEKLRDYVVVGDDDAREVNVETDEEDDKVDYKLILVSGSRENIVWFWDYETGLPIDKIVVPSISTARLCDTSFTNAVWLDESYIVANNANGQVIEWKVEFKYKNDRLHLLAKESLAPYPVEKIFHVIRAEGITKTDNNGRYLWCSSINRNLICLQVTESGKASIVLDYSCITTSNRCLVENPLESMVIAISSSPRIEKLNLTCLQSDNIPFKSFTNKIKGLVMNICWHPEEEEKLAFGTKEGRIGILDTDHSNNVPVILKPFTNKEVYGLQWCYLTNARQEKRLVLMACSKIELVYYPMSGAQKYEPIKCSQFGQVSEIHAVNNLCFLGTQCGSLYVNDLDQNLKQLYYGKLSKRYISSLAFKNNYLAVSCNDNTIRVINFSNGFCEEAVKESTLLEGHTDGVCKLRWSRDDTMLLVSCSFDSTIRVWDALSATCLKMYHTGSIAYAAIFSPLNENIILYVGKRSTLSSFDYTKQHDEPSKAIKHPKLVLAVEDVTKPVGSKQKKKKTARELSKLKEVADGNDVDSVIDQLTDGVKKVMLKEAKAAVPATSNLTTTFQLTNRETNKTKDVLECIVKMLRTPDPEPEREPIDYYNDGDSSDQDCCSDCMATPEPVEVKQPAVEPASSNGDDAQTEQEKMFYNQKLFSTPEHLKQLIAEEANLHSITDTTSIGLVMLPQMLHKLKETILGCISKKKLTPQLLALAPYVSHMFWRQCCQAYGYQLIESQQSLAAVPFFLASHKADTSIEELCDAKYFREAWVICRMNKLPDDPVLEQVATKWANHLNAIGNYEAAALVWTGIKKYKEALDVLTKRRDITEDIQRTIEELNAKLQHVATGKHD
ncbi:protein rigor mortis [Anopheles maculipalpis]|uniref:protein rigor mortis n=1 Tax=Anopheles maculipalpis TaxID=1496333 RepID=UPI002158E445|nr:protein rigor mortis [Anopheles maculipalpis]